MSISSNLNPTSESESRPSRGFTFIEVVIAMFVSAITVASAYGLLTYSLRILRSAENRTTAFYEARSGMEYLRALSYDELDYGTWSLQDEDLDLDFLYTVSINPSNSALKDVVVQVAWTNAANLPRSVQLFSSMCKPMHE